MSAGKSIEIRQNWRQKVIQGLIYFESFNNNLNSINFFFRFRILRLLDCWELLLFHGLKSTYFKQSHGFWDIAYEHLTRHEKERFDGLRHVHSDRGKCRSLLRAALNERSLERYVLMWINDENLYEKYEPYACILDKNTIEEMPKLANALNNILFALTVDAPEVNNDRKVNLMEREEPIIPVPQPNNLEVHKKVSKVRRKVIDFDETKEKVGASKECDVVVVRQRTPSPAIVEENGYTCTINSNKGMIEEQLMFALDHQSQCGNSNSSFSMMNDSNSSNEERNRKSSLVKSKESLVIPVPTEETGIEVKEDSFLSSKGSSINSGSEGSLPTLNVDIDALKQKLKEKEERCAILETQVAELSL